MSADVLRQAANLMRESNRHDVTREAETFVAVADWLDAEAERVERGRWSVTFGGAPMFPPSADALAVARAYLNDPAP